MQGSRLPPFRVSPQGPAGLRCSAGKLCPLAQSPGLGGRRAQGGPCALSPAWRRAPMPDGQLRPLGFVYFPKWQEGPLGTVHARRSPPEVSGRARPGHVAPARAHLAPHFAVSFLSLILEVWCPKFLSQSP